MRNKFGALYFGFLFYHKTYKGLCLKFDQHSTSFTLCLILNMHLYSKHLCFKQIIRYCTIIYYRGPIFVDYEFFGYS